jgi:hypothetical protein
MFDSGGVESFVDRTSRVEVVLVAWEDTREDTELTPTTWGYAAGLVVVGVVLLLVPGARRPARR